MKMNDDVSLISMHHEMKILRFSNEKNFNFLSIFSFAKRGSQKKNHNDLFGRRFGL